MFSCLQILEAFLWFVLITLLNVTLIILTLSVSRLLNLLLRLVAFLLFLNPQCLASISRWITASSFFFSSRRRHTRFKCDWEFRRVLFRSARSPVATHRWKAPWPGGPPARTPNVSLAKRSNNGCNRDCSG